MVSNLLGEGPFSVFLKNDRLFDLLGEREHAEMRLLARVILLCSLIGQPGQDSDAATSLSNPIFTCVGCPGKYCRGFSVCEFSE